MPEGAIIRLFTYADSPFWQPRDEHYYYFTVWCRFTIFLVNIGVLCLIVKYMTVPFFVDLVQTKVHVSASIITGYMQHGFTLNHGQRVQRLM